jgi:outer membrane protein insertion porin family
MRRRYFFSTLMLALALAGTDAVRAAFGAERSEELAKKQNATSKREEQKAQRPDVVQFMGEHAFSQQELRSVVKEQLETIDQYGLSPARADDLAFFVELFYRKHGYSKVDVHYDIEGARRLKLVIDEGPKLALGVVRFEGNRSEPAERLFDYVVGPTRQRYSSLERTLPFVQSDIKEGTDLLYRFYIAEGFLDVKIDPPVYTYLPAQNQVNVTVPVHEGRQYFFGQVSFSGQTAYGPAALRGEIKDLLKQPYTDARLEDIRRRLQSYFKRRGYYDVNVSVSSNPQAVAGGRVPVHVTVAPGPVYHFGEASVTGLTRLHPGFVRNRFTRLQGKTYSPDILDERFRVLMKTGLFNILQIKPVPVGDDTLNLDISAQEAKSKEFGISVGYGTYEGGILGLQFQERDLFGTGRPITASIEISQRSYKGELVYEDPFLFDTDIDFKNSIAALTFDYDGYSKFEIGDHIQFTRQFTKYYDAGLVFSARHVQITSASIRDNLLGDTNYFIDTIGWTQTLDLRDNPHVAPNGFVASNTFDVATSALGSEIELVRSTAGMAYFLPFTSKVPEPGTIPDLNTPPWKRWFEKSGLAFSARAGVLHSLGNSTVDEATAIPIDERFFNGGSNSVRSFGERDLGPHDPKGNPIGGEFYTIFNVEYTFPLYGELEGATFFDAGNLLPTSDHPSLDNMRYALGLGLRYKLPIGPIRLDYGFNPDPGPHEDFGAFHFSFGFAF